QLKRSLAELVSATSIALLQTKQRLSVIGILVQTLSSCDRLIIQKVA
ncbi:7702_t:CDS:1, partial [Gigaspora rosea]